MPCSHVLGVVAVVSLVAMQGCTASKIALDRRLENAGIARDIVGDNARCWGTCLGGTVECKDRGNPPREKATEPSVKADCWVQCVTDAC